MFYNDYADQSALLSPETGYKHGAVMTQVSFDKFVRWLGNNFYE